MTIEDLKQHCIKTIKISEAIESIPNVKITDRRSLQEHKMVLKLIEAWEKVRAEIEKESKTASSNLHWGEAMGLNKAIDIIDKHIPELRGDTDGK